MELRQIQYFIQLYQDLNITKASKNLYISQQGLSKSVSRLEEELGFSLFERHPSGVIPTEKANILYTHFNKIYNSYHELVLAIDTIHQNRILNVCSFHGFALSCDKDLFSEYRNAHPEISIRYEETDNDDILSRLLYCKADVAFMLAPIPKELTSLQVIRREPIYIAMDKRHPLAAKKSINIEDIQGQKLLLLNNMQEYNAHILQNADTRNISYDVFDTVGMNEFFHLLYSSGYIGFSSSLVYQYYNFPEIIFVPFSQKQHPDFVMEVHLTIPANHSPDAETQQYIDYITQTAESALNDISSQANIHFEQKEGNQ